MHVHHRPLFLVHFFAVVALPPKFTFFFEDVITRQQFSFSLCEIRYSPVL